jgi:hypothetical protein
MKLSFNFHEEDYRRRPPDKEGIADLFYAASCAQAIAKVGDDYALGAQDVESTGTLALLFTTIEMLIEPVVTYLSEYAHPEEGAENKEGA